MLVPAVFFLDFFWHHIPLDKLLQKKIVVNDGRFDHRDDKNGFNGNILNLRWIHLFVLLNLHRITVSPRHVVVFQ